MVTFIMFGEYSHDSIKQISSQRTEQSKDLIKKNGGELKSGYAILGKADLVLIVEFPEITNAMKASIELSKMLGISFTTAPAVSVEEYDQLMG